MRRWAALLLCLLLLSWAAPTAAAAEAQIQVLIDGSAVSFDVPPVNQAGRVLVPLRAIGEALGYDVGYDDATKTVTLTRASTSITLVLGSQEARVNGETQTLDVPAQAIAGRTMVPVRFVAEALGAQVEWDGVRKAVLIQSQLPASEPAGSGSTGGGTGSGSGQSSLDGKALLAKVNAASQNSPNQKGTGTMLINMKLTAPELPPEGLTMTTEAAVDYHLNGDEMLMSMEMSMDTLMGKLNATMGVAVKDGALYQSEDGAPWVYVQDAKEGESPLASQSLPDFQAMADEMEASAAVTVAGTEIIDGRAVTVLEVTVPGSGMAQSVETLLQLGDLTAEAGTSLTLSDMRMKLWVDPETGALYRGQYVFSATLTEDTTVMTMDFDADFRYTPTTEPIQWPELPSKS